MQVTDLRREPPTGSRRKFWDSPTKVVDGLAGVAASDACLLLLGEHYGDPFPETRLNPTAEEHVAARGAGIPRIVVRKAGVTPDDRQKDLIEEVRSYRDGVFYNEFIDTADLQTKVAATVRALAQAPSPLGFAPLDAPAPVDWRWDWPPEHQGHSQYARHRTPTAADRRRHGAGGVQCLGVRCGPSRRAWTCSRQGVCRCPGLGYCWGWQRAHRNVSCAAVTGGAGWRCGSRGTPRRSADDLESALVVPTGAC